MNLFFALVVFGLGLWAWPTGITDLPFSALTLKLVAGLLLAGWLYYSALKLLGESFKEDRIWPWRWTWRSLGDMLLRGVMVAATLWFSVYLSSHTRLAEGAGFFVIWALAACVCLGFMFGDIYDTGSSQAKVVDVEPSEVKQAAVNGAWAGGHAIGLALRRMFGKHPIK
jgi:hypothetical protein